MSMLRLEHVYKVYPGHGKKDPDVLAVSDFSIDIKEKEFIVFIGPSGCGKSTTLRMIAGLEENTKGNIYIDDELMNDVEPKYRNIAMVFQNYALYPHMTARENMSFGLKNMKVPTPILDEAGNQKVGIDHKLVKAIEKKIKEIEKKLNSYKKLEEDIKHQEEVLKDTSLKEKKRKQEELKLEKYKNRFDESRIASLEEKLNQAHIDLERYQKEEVPLYKDKHLPKAEITKRVNDAAKVLDIEELLDRKPKAMSGGQRQRVALGRAIVRTPKIFLLDEPLSNLDAKLRAQMRVEIINLYQKLDTPFIYVTHDQVEAMSMGTRIVILRKGIIQQVDTPTNLYDYPINRFVAGFLGTPQMSFVEVEIKKIKDKLEIKFSDKYILKVPLNELRPLQDEYLDGEAHKAIFGIRSEDVIMKEKGTFSLEVGLVEVLGSETLVYADSKEDNPFRLVIKSKDRVVVNQKDNLSIDFINNKIHLFSNDEKEISIFKKEV